MPNNVSPGCPPSRTIDGSASDAQFRRARTPSSTTTRRTHGRRLAWIRQRGERPRTRRVTRTDLPRRATSTPRPTQPPDRSPFAPRQPAPLVVFEREGQAFVAHEAAAAHCPGGLARGKKSTSGSSRQLPSRIRARRSPRTQSTVADDSVRPSGVAPILPLTSRATVGRWSPTAGRRSDDPPIGAPGTRTGRDGWDRRPVPATGCCLRVVAVVSRSGGTPRRIECAPAGAWLQAANGRRGKAGEPKHQNDREATLRSFSGIGVRHTAGGHSRAWRAVGPESDENGLVREAHELIALALALEDEGRPDEDVVAALVAAAEGHILRLQSAYASTLYLTHELPFDQRAHDLSAMFLTALKYVAAHEPVDGRGGSADTEWLRRGGDREQRGVLADRLAIATGDQEAVLRNARQLQADLDRLRRER
jgi:hypothetical protein